MTLKGVLHVEGVLGELTFVAPDLTLKDGARFRADRTLLSPDDTKTFSTSTSISSGADGAKVVERRNGEGRAELNDEDDDVDAIESRLCAAFGVVGIRMRGEVSEEPTVCRREFEDRA